MTWISAGLGQLVESYRYAYPSARAKALKSLLLTEEQFNRILEAIDLEDAIGLLRETSYGPSLTGKGDFLDLESALQLSLAKELQKVSDFLPGMAKPIFRLYLSRFEAANIKAVLAAVRAGYPPKKTLKLVLPIYLELTAQDYEKMAGSKSVENALGALAHTVYGPALNAGLSDYKKMEILLPIEAALDSHIFGHIFHLISSSKGYDIDTLRQFISMEIDLMNISSVVRLKSAHVNAKVIMKYLLPKGLRLKTGVLEGMSESRDLEELVNRLKDTAYYSELAKALAKMPKGSNRAQTLELAVLRLKEGFSRELEGRYPLGISPVLGYMLAKDREVRTLIAILKLKEAGFNAEEIRQVLPL